MSEIDDLLKKLRLLDAPTYENICKWGLNWNHPDEVALSEYIIQGEVQRAIMTKRWESAVIINPRNDDGKIIYLAWVTPRTQVKCYPHLGLEAAVPVGEDGSIMQWRDGCKQGSYGDNQAHALLKAYITCLESQA